MYTLYTSVSGSLPTTSYVKIIDIWLLYHLFVPFLIFLIIFKREHLQTREFKDFKEKINFNENTDSAMKFLGEKAIPFTTVTFAVIYFTVCLVHYYL